MQPNQAVLRTLEALFTYLDELRRQSLTLALVPTMGALHAGHLSLVTRARECADAVLMSIFVNPTQFGENEDFETYPREFIGDQRKAFSAGCDAIFAPDSAIMYPAGYNTTVVPGPRADILCGKSRPGHFSGVCTIVLKLFHLTRCDVALFGEKDYQQLALIKAMVRDLNLSVVIEGCPIVREADGLAMSSRNQRLTPSSRSAARALSQGLFAARSLWFDGERRATDLSQVVLAHLTRAGGVQVDYVAVLDPDLLTPLDGLIHQDCLVAVAAQLGDVRLIDNIVLRA